MGICRSVEVQPNNFDIVIQEPKRIKSFEPTHEIPTYDESKIILIQQHYRAFKGRKQQLVLSPKTTSPTQNETQETKNNAIDFEPITNEALIIGNKYNNLQQKLPPVSLKNGGIYTGQWKYGKPYGQGKYEIHDCYLEGIWKDGYIHREGTYVTKNEIYKGEWKNNIFHGFGEYTYSDGKIYSGIYIVNQGQWVMGVQEGKGQETYKDKSKYEGMFKNGYKHGYGIFFMKDGSQYEGQFQRDYFQGYGKFIWPQQQKVYEGHWLQGIKEGQGNMKWQNGCIYKGRYHQGQKHGYGEMIYSDGRIYKGNWNKGLQDGEGIFIDKLKRQRKGLWSSGKIVRWLQ